MAKLSEDKELMKAMKRVKIADKVRLVCLFAALLLVLFIFYGNKFAMETSWYPDSRGTAYSLLSLAVMVMLGATIMKMVFAAAYNRLLKKKNDHEI